MIAKFTKKDRLIWWMASVWLIIDSITGLFISYVASMPLSQIFKLIILILIIDKLVYKKYILILTFSILIYLTVYIIHLNINSIGFSEPLVILSKFLSLIYLYLYFRYTCKLFPTQFIKYSKYVFIIAWVTLSINILLGIWGFGVPTYKAEDSDSLGVKGFFFAGNELGGIMAVVAPMMFYLAIKNLNGIKLFFAYSSIIIVGVLIGTKAAILSTLISALALPILYSSKKSRIKIITISSLIIFVLGMLIIKFIEDASVDSINRWTFFYNNGGISRLLLSGRDEFWEMKSHVFFNSNFITQFLGIGVENEKIVERDHLDAILIFGYSGGLIIIMFFCFLLINSINCRHNNSLMKVIIFSNILVLSIGFIAGHVWFSAMASIYIALINSFSSLHYNGTLLGRSIK